MTRLVFGLAAVLGAAAVVMMGANFIGSNTLAFVVTAVIGGVFAIGVVELVRYRGVTATLEGTLGAALGAAAAESSNAVAALDTWLQKLHPSLRHPVRQRIEGERIALPGPVLTPYLVSLLVMLGLLGTFIGLVETLKGVVTALEGSSDLASIRLALTAPMDGLGLAFGTSVAGVAASAMLGLMSTLSRYERTLATRELDGRIATDLRRFSSRHRQDEAFDALRQQSQSLPAIADSLAQMVDKVAQMTDTLAQRLTAGQDDFHASAKASYEQLAVTVNEAVQAGVDHSRAALEEAGRSVGTSMLPIVEEAMGAITAEVNAGVRRTHEGVTGAMREQLNELQAEFGKTSAQVAGAWQDGVAAHTQSSVALVDGVRDALDAFNTRFSDAATEVLAGLRRAVDEGQERQAAAHEDQLGRWAEALRHGQQEQAERLAQTSTTLAAELQSLASTQAELLSASESLVTARIESEKAWLASHEQRMEALVDSTRAAVSVLHDDEAARGQAAVDRLAALEGTVAEHLATLGQSLEAPMAQLIELASETPRAAAEVIGKLREEITHNAARENELLEERRRIMAELDTVSGSLAGSTSSQVAAIEKLVTSSATMLQEVGQQFARQVADETAKAGDVTDLVAASMAEVSSLGEAFKVAVELYNGANERLLEGLQRIETALEQASNRSDEQLGFYVAQAREVIDYSVQAQQEIFDGLRRLDAGNAAQAGAAAEA
ncbi:MAG: DUF802 domain-containing protein [Gammaproteobacteria bacterium]|nr:DUF802 domain-containing protein [Gammaproteobacteria bacterium]